jgi:hypothetical protein
MKRPPITLSGTAEEALVVAKYKDIIMEKCNLSSITIHLGDDTITFMRND